LVGFFFENALFEVVPMMAFDEEMDLSEDQVLSLAPDESSKKSGKELANPAKWGKRQINERALWGECQGSGKLPYQTQVDLVNLAFKCTCPSRKFPCKHGLGLSLLYVRDRKLFTVAEEPDWVSNWLDKRVEKEEKKTEKKAKEKPVDTAAQAKRQENRAKRVEEGMSELRLWLHDIVRNGLLTIPGKGPAHFEAMAKRMVDAQAPGLANLVRKLGAVPFYREAWQTPFLDQLVRMYLLLESFPRLESLPPALQYEVKTWIGFTQSLDEVKAEQGISDDWFVLAKQVEKEDSLTVERNWLYGIRSGRFALVLQFYVRGQVPEVNIVPGSWIQAELCFFQGAHPLRALIKNQQLITQKSEVPGLNTWNEVLQSTSEMMAQNPFYENFPVVIDGVVPLLANNQWWLRDHTGAGVAIAATFSLPWKLLSLSGGLPVKLFALGKETTFEPLGVWVDGEYKMLV
jgi:hypothetical protein